MCFSANRVYIYQKKKLWICLLSLLLRTDGIIILKAQLEHIVSKEILKALVKLITFALDGP